MNALQTLQSPPKGAVGQVVYLYPPEPLAPSGGLEDNLPPVLTVAQTAQLLSAHKNTVRTLIARGAIPAHKIGRRWYIPKAHLMAIFGGGHNGI